MRIVLFIALSLGIATHAGAGRPDDLVRQAQQAIASGDDAQASIDALIDALASTRNEDEADDLIDAIESLGDADGTSPQAVKQYFRAKAPAALRKIIGGPFSWSLRGDAVMVHRTLEASDADLKAAIAQAMADTSEQKGYLQSRGELLQDWLDSRSPERHAELDAAPTTTAATSNDALARARALGLSVSLDQLMDSARRGAVEEVTVLLDAGLDVNAKSSAWMSPLSAAATGRCALPTEPITGNLAVMDLLLQRGANPDAFDERGNPILMPAVQQCPLAIVQRLLDGGAQVNPVNKQDFTPLEMAFVLGKIDIAELLVARGARRDPAKLDRLFAETPSDPRVKAVLARAGAKGK